MVSLSGLVGAKGNRSFRVGVPNPCPAGLKQLVIKSIVINTLVTYIKKLSILQFTVGCVGPRFDTVGNIVPHSILGSVEDFKMEAVHQGQMEVSQITIKLPISRKDCALNFSLTDSL